MKCSPLPGVALLAAAATASANPRPLPFTYPTDSLAKGTIEIEQFVDLTPVRVDDGSKPSFAPITQFTTEVEVGVTDRLEIGMYFAFYDDLTAFHWDAIKQRARYRFADPGEWPIDVALYLELETMHDELSLEEKVLLAKRFGRWHGMANVWVEQTERRAFDEVQRSLHFIVNPTMGVVYQATPIFQPGIEYWARGEFGTVGDSAAEIENNRIHHFIGPTAFLDFGKLWWSVGVYANLTNVNTPQLDWTYGAWWGRTVLGLTL
jgi:hypothetical protein